MAKSTKCSECGSEEIRMCECGMTEFCNDCDAVIQK